MTDALRHLPVLEYLKRQLNGSLTIEDTTHMLYPTAISRLLGLRIIEIAEAMANTEKNLILVAKSVGDLIALKE